MLAYHAAGFTTWDLADHYGPAEDFMGEFRRQLRVARGAGALVDVQAFTKWVPHTPSVNKNLYRTNYALSVRRKDTARGRYK